MYSYKNTHKYSTFGIYFIIINYLLLSHTYRSIIKGTIVLLPLLGITWIIGIFALNVRTTIFLWIFTLVNSFQVYNQVYIWSIFFCGAYKSCHVVLR